MTTRGIKIEVGCSKKDSKSGYVDWRITYRGEYSNFREVQIVQVLISVGKGSSSKRWTRRSKSLTGGYRESMRSFLRLNTVLDQLSYMCLHSHTSRFGSVILRSVQGVKGVKWRRLECPCPGSFPFSVNSFYPLNGTDLFG